MDKKSDDRRIKKTRMLLKLTFVELLQNRSVQKLTVKDICEKADISRGTFYFHFSDIYNLSEHVKNDFVDTFMKIFEDYLFAPVIVPPLNMFLNMAHVFETSKDYYSLLLTCSESAAYIEALGAAANERWIDFCINKLHVENVGANRYRNKFIVSGLAGVAKMWAGDPDNVPMRDVAEVVNKLLVNGVIDGSQNVPTDDMGMLLDSNAFKKE